MLRLLSTKSSLDVLKQDAKRWLHALRTGNSESQHRLLTAWPAAPSTPTLRDVQHALAREYGLADWTSLTAALRDLALDRQSHAERVEAVLRHGWDGDVVTAQRIAVRYPEVCRDNLFTAASCGDLDEVRRWLTINPALANAVGGSLAWTALAYVAYSRIDAQHAARIAQLLMNAGADPNFQFDDGWGNPFTPLTGAIGRGEGVKPPHPKALDLVDLFLASGANPFDTQALYNTSIVDDDITWTALLWAHCPADGRAARWSLVDGPALGGKYKVGTLNYLLGNAVGQNHLARARWLLEHGADATTRHAYTGEAVHTMARLSGFRAMAALLARHGAHAVTLSGQRAFLAVLMSGSEVEIRTHVADNPSLVQSPAPLLHAAERGRAELVALLLALGAPVNGTDHEGISPLHQAVHADSVDTINVLLAGGADVDVRERKWRSTPMGWACVLGKSDAAERLAPLSRDPRALAASARVSRLAVVLRDDAALANHRLAGHDTPTPLFCLPDDEEAAAEVTRVLLEHGADPRVTDPRGRTATEVARMKGLDEAADAMSAAESRTAVP